MTGWHVAHLIALSAWGGLLLGEIVLEMAGRGSSGLEKPAWRLHFLVDIFVELPLMVAVGFTGVVLLLKTGLDDQLTIKVGLAIGALLSGVLCFYFVLIRRQALQDERTNPQLVRLTRRIFLVAAIGITLAAIAAWIGAQRVGWL